VLSVRQYLVGLVAALDPSTTAGRTEPLSPATAVAGLVIALVLGYLIGVRALERYQLSAGD
jgi:hypothetical protein